MEKEVDRLLALLSETSLRRSHVALTGDTADLDEATWRLLGVCDQVLARCGEGAWRTQVRRGTDESPGAYSSWAQAAMRWAARALASSREAG